MTEKPLRTPTPWPLQTTCLWCEWNKRIKWRYGEEEGGGRLSLKIPCLPRSDCQHKTTIYRKLYGTFWYKFSLRSRKESQTPFPCLCCQNSFHQQPVPQILLKWAHCTREAGRTCYTLCKMLHLSFPGSSGSSFRGTVVQVDDRVNLLCNTELLHSPVQQNLRKKKKSLINYPKLSA